REGSVTVHQNADLYAVLLAENDEVIHHLESGRGAWLQIISGEVMINGTTLKGGRRGNQRRADPQDRVHKGFRVSAV
ncbi:MAG TPA: hypothetical protein VM943_01930, partial [Pyrinomonadaceae bacterium]|nr:hypothetical protein [Pyrinomonadaceae bacterium]